MPEHPTKDELSGFVLGTLPPDSTDSVAQHIERCPPCHETVFELDAHKDTLLQGLRHGSAPPVDEVCRQAMDKAAAIADGGSREQKPSELTVASPGAQPSVVGAPSGPVPSREQFLAALRASEVFDADHWSELAAKPAVAQAADGAALARALVECGALTKFQATLLYQNKPKGLLFGEYVVLDRIGAGGMGQVFKARHRSMNRVVALKILAKAAVGSPEAVKRFQREVRAAARLVHPNIVIAHDAGQQEGVHFLVMEYVEGKDLSQLLKQNGPLPVDQAIDYILQAARGLEYAHGEGVVHRDIKPANLLLDKKGIVKILDMGLARFDDAFAGGGGIQDGLTQSGQVMGTVDYMAPEQAMDTREADAKADVYSLGCTLHRLVIGENVYGGETLVQKLMAHREQPIPSLAARRPETPAALDDVFRRMVAKDPAQRLPSMRQVIEALEQARRSIKSDTETVQGGNVGSFSETEKSAGRDSPRGGLPRPAVGTRGSGKKPPARLLIAGGAAGFLFVALGVWFIIKNREGQEVARIKATDGSTVETQMDPDPKPSPAKPSSSAPPPATVATASIPQPGPPLPPVTPIAGEHGEVVVDLPPWTPAKDAPQPALAPFTQEAAAKLQTSWAEYLGRKPVQENSLGMSLALVPPGEFDAVYMDPNVSAIKPEMMRRRLRISQPFDLGATEVTVAQFRRFADATGYQTDAEKDGKGGHNSDGGEPKPEWNWKNPGSYKQTDDMPVVQVSWNDANAFCEWLSKEEGVRYRLPTEAEWEFACRAGSDGYHAVCEKERELTQHAWVKENGSAGGAFVRPVANWSANAFGLFDVLGNAWEWCADGGDRRSDERTHAVDPWGWFVYPSVRGCGFDVPAKDTHPAFRRRHPYDLPRSSIGFRVLRQVSPEPPPGPLDRPLLVNRNGQLFRKALVARPAPIPGLRSWSVELAGDGHATSATITTVWSPQGNLIATSGYEDPAVRLWDRNGKLVRVLARHHSYVPQLTFSPDGNWLVTIGEDKYLIWKVATGACHAVIPNANTCRPVFSPDGKMLAVYKDGPRTFQTLDLNTGRIVGTAGGISVTGGGSGDQIAWSPDGKTIATVDLGDSLYFHTAPGLERTERVPAAKKLYMLAWSPDGKWLAACVHGGDSNVLIYDAESRTLKTTLDRSKLDRGISTLVWSKDSRRILQGGSQDRFFIIWDALTGSELLRSTGGGGPASWSPDEQEIAVGGKSLQIFDAQTGFLKRETVQVGQSLGKLGFPSCFDGERLFARAEGNPPITIKILDAKSGAFVDRWEKLPSGRLSISPSQDQIAIFDKSPAKNLFLVDAQTGKQVRELKPHPEAIHAVAWSPDGRQLASGGKDKILRIWNVADARLEHELPGHEGEISSLGWSPDGKQLASVDAGAIRLWDPATGKPVSTHKDAPSKFSTSSAALAWTGDCQALWLALQSPPYAAKLDVPSAAWSKPEPVANHPFMYRRGETSQPGGFLTTAFVGGQWHPDGRRFLSDFNGTGWMRGYDVEHDRPLGVVVPFISGNNWLVVGPEGHYNGPKGIEDHLIYIGETDTGENTTLSPADFQKRFGWKNDVGQARLLGEPAR